MDHSLLTLLCVLSCFSCVLLFLAPWAVARQAPPSMGFSRQEYQSELPFPSLGDLPDTGIVPASLALADRFFTTEPAGKLGKQSYKAGNKELNTSLTLLNIVHLCLCKNRLPTLIQVLHMMFYMMSTHVLSCFSCVRLFATLWIVARQAPLSMGLSGKEK